VFVQKMGAFSILELGLNAVTTSDQSGLYINLGSLAGLATVLIFVCTW